MKIDLSFITSTATFNGKPNWKNVVAVILGLGGAFVLAAPWFYHLIVQLFVMPKSEWIDPFATPNLPLNKEYPNGFCDFLCNVEIIMIHQIGMLREGFGREYCQEDEDNGDKT